MVKRTGQILKLVPIMPPNQNLDIQETSYAFRGKIKIILLNSPHNPLVKVFTNDELQTIANLVIKHDA